jgi:hypothetical protein
MKAGYFREVELFVWAAFSLLIATAVIGNGIVMYIIVRCKAMHHSFNYFLLNMACADLLMALLNCGTTWTFNLYYEWWYGKFCPVNVFFG